MDEKKGRIKRRGKDKMRKFSKTNDKRRDKGQKKGERGRKRKTVQKK